MNIGKYVELYSDDLSLKNYSENSISNYSCQIKLFLETFNSICEKPSEINESQIKRWLLSFDSVNSRRHKLSAIKLFYKYTINQPFKLKYIEYPRPEKKLPIVLSVSEIQKLFTACENTKHKVILALLYSTGMRVGELINLKWSHIDRHRMIINIIAGKGKKDRQVPLESSIIPLLERYYREYKSKPYVLSGQFSDQYSETSVNAVLKQLAHKAKLNKNLHAHLIRHCSFTHLLEAGVDISIIQKIAGHNNPKTTAIYTHISHSLINSVFNPVSKIAI